MISMLIRMIIAFLRKSTPITPIQKRNVERKMYEWSFSATAEWMVGALLVVSIVALMFV